jgi:hypothetical protein
MVPRNEWEEFKHVQSEILQQLKNHKDRNASVISVKYITAKEFMAAVRIKRTKFDQLVHTNKVRIIKKSRKIYVPVSEIDRYFNDNTVQ